MADELRNAWKQRRLAVVDRLCRSIAGRRRGPRKRRYDMPVGFRPTIEDAEAHLQLPATLGGMQADRVDFEEARADLLEQQVFMPRITQEQIAEAKRDKRAMIVALCRAPRRRASPPWTAPLEAWLMLMRPRRLLKKLPEGVGAPLVSELDNPVFHSHLHSVLKDIRRSGRVPFSWVRSVGWNIPKHKASAACSGFGPFTPFAPSRRLGCLL